MKNCKHLHRHLPEMCALFQGFACLVRLMFYWFSTNQVSLIWQQTGFSLFGTHQDWPNLNQRITFEVCTRPYHVLQYLVKPKIWYKYENKITKTRQQTRSDSTWQQKNPCGYFWHCASRAASHRMTCYVATGSDIKGAFV